MARDNTIDYARIHDLTIEEIKACPIFQHMSDQEAGDVIETLKIFTKIAYDVYKKDGRTDGNTK
jgi:hypothetical protein